MDLAETEVTKPAMSRQQRPATLAACRCGRSRGIGGLHAFRAGVAQQAFLSKLCSVQIRQSENDLVLHNTCGEGSSRFMRRASGHTNAKG